MKFYKQKTPIKNFLVSFSNTSVKHPRITKPNDFLLFYPLKKNRLITY